MDTTDMLFFLPAPVFEEATLPSYADARCFYSVLLSVTPPKPQNARLVQPLGPMLHNAGPRTHCIHGHLYDEKNTMFVWKAGKRCRECRICKVRGNYNRRHGL